MTSEGDNCGLSSILPISCRDRAEVFARSLQSRLSTLGGHDSPNNERSWLGPHDRPVTLSQPLQNLKSTDRFYDLEQGLDFPLSPQDEITQPDFHVVLNKDNLNGFNGDCHCPKFEEDEKVQKQFAVKINGLTKCTSNDSVDSEIFYDIDDDPPSAYFFNGLKNSESCKSDNSDLNSQGTSSSNLSEVYCTSLDCTPQPSLSDDVSTLSIQKLSESSSTSDLNGLSERSSSEETSSQSSRDEVDRVNGFGCSENVFSKLNGHIYSNPLNFIEHKNTIGCREEINIENLMGSEETNVSKNEKVCLECEKENLHHDQNGKNVNETTDLELEEANCIVLNGNDYNGYNKDNEIDFSTTEILENKGESTDETDFRVIENGDGFIPSETIVSRIEIDIRLCEEIDVKDIEEDKEICTSEQTNKESPKSKGEENDYDDDDENTIPRIRRCSSLRTGKTPPDTPGRKKIVRFADVLGLDLADVRTFLDEIPKVPKSAYDDLSDVDITDSSDSSDLLLLGGTKYHGIKTDRILVPMFEQPSMLPNFLDFIRDYQVCLENAFVDDPVLFSIRGFVRVRNLDFNKSVHIRYSLDSWMTFSDVQATYCSNSCDGFSDKFSFIIYANTLQVGQRIEFACRFQCKGCQYWDNNRGKNYIFQCLPTATNPATSPAQAAVRVNTHDDWGASFY